MISGGKKTAAILIALVAPIGKFLIIEENHPKELEQSAISNCRWRSRGQPGEVAPPQICSL
jgi:hypothetical protein